LGENTRYILGAKTWYNFGENYWYILTRKMTLLKVVAIIAPSTGLGIAAAHPIDEAFDLG
jgi:hypothetical protein